MFKKIFIGVGMGVVVGVWLLVVILGFMDESIKTFSGFLMQMAGFTFLWGVLVFILLKSLTLDESINTGRVGYIVVALIILVSGAFTILCVRGTYDAYIYEVAGRNSADVTTTALFGHKTLLRGHDKQPGKNAADAHGLTFKMIPPDSSSVIVVLMYQQREAEAREEYLSFYEVFMTLIVTIMGAVVAMCLDRGTRRLRPGSVSVDTWVPL